MRGPIQSSLIPGSGRGCGSAVCEAARRSFSNYLDGSLSGLTMSGLAAHLDSCGECNREFASWRLLQKSLASLGPARPPADLALRLRVAISKERASTFSNYLGRCWVRWQNTVAPLLLQASAGFAGAVLLLGTIALLAVPEPLAARDEPIGMASGPHFLYSSVETDPATIGQRTNPLIVEAYIDGNGRVYDYQIVSGPDDSRTRSQLEELLLFSVFEPARVFGQPVRGLAVLSFAGVSVKA